MRFTGGPGRRRLLLGDFEVADEASGAARERIQRSEGAHLRPASPPPGKMDGRDESEGGVDGVKVLG
nr:uncharacterized protein CTRU02_14603 [Colletotrichum truncatum]KAF6782047.1 hypothetical protein CTRU02_14603 [Colletotrichum truncatum]